MTTYTYTVIYADSEIAFAEAETYQGARAEALAEVPRMYPRDELTFIANCSTSVISSVSGPCY